jgi:HlyD family secretion protein
VKRKIFITIGIIVLAIVGFFGYRFYRQGREFNTALGKIQTAALERGTLKATIGASGSVRSNQSAELTWQTSGTVNQVLAALGDRVSEGQELANLVESSLAQNIILAQADMVAAQKALDDLKNSRLQQAQALQSVEDSQRALDDLKDPQLTQAQAELAVANAQKAVDLMEQQFRYAQSPSNQASIDEAEAQVVLAKNRLDQAKEKYAPYANKPESNVTRAQLLTQLSQAQQQYDFAISKLNALLGTAGPTDLAIAKANLETALAQLAQAQREFDRVKNGPTEAELALAEARLADAQRQWERLKDGPNPDDIAAAEARVAAVQAALNQKRITAPFDGVITQVYSIPGDQVNPGTVAFRLDDLSRLLVDILVSEVDINQVQVGQPVEISFDAIPSRKYQGIVTEVASVGQAQQGSVNFPVTVELTDVDELVKPGMTAAANVQVQELLDVLLVPNRAVRAADGGKREVYVIRDNQPVAVLITLGQASDTNSQVLEGDIQAGDLIVLNPSSLPQVLFDFNGPPPGARMFGGGMP